MNVSRKHFHMTHVRTCSLLYEVVVGGAPDAISQRVLISCRFVDEGKEDDGGRRIVVVVVVTVVVVPVV